MNNKYQRWTREEELVILSYVKQYPNNLKYAFEKAALSLNRTTRGVHSRYYEKLKNNNTCFVTVSSKYKAVNTKNGKKEKQNKTNTNIFKKILKLLGL